jgi:hypothetical protein
MKRNSVMVCELGECNVHLTPGRSPRIPPNSPFGSFTTPKADKCMKVYRLLAMPRICQAYVPHRLYTLYNQYVASLPLSNPICTCRFSISAVALAVAAFAPFSRPAPSWQEPALPLSQGLSWRGPYTYIDHLNDLIYCSFYM